MRKKRKKKPEMVTYVAWAACNCASQPPNVVEFEMPESATEAEVEAEGEEMARDLLNNFDSGWCKKSDWDAR